MRFQRWMTMATDMHSEYVTLIAFPRQQWFRTRASLLRLGYTYIARLVYFFLSLFYLYFTGLSKYLGTKRAFHIDSAL
jgi:hypothetical protein